jgi:myo-inositol-1(or 4)-monophosphatase
MIDSANAVQCNALTVAAVDAALAAGAILKTQFGKSFTVLSKDGRQDLVTECDKKAEEVAIAILKQRFPTHAILAEESGWSGDRKAPVIWVIDPLDGTRNFASNVPTFSVSIAAVVKGVVVSSAIFAPMLNELFVAERGKGAYLNGERLQVSSQKNIQKALLATGYPYNMHENPLSCMEVSTRITKQGPMMLNFGRKSRC